ncbi:terminase large subunit [Mycobacterium intracellulare]|uniref:terminase large subunit n=1 Tax=Mycobacterium intracellulare TaxID=1767 RepID=UPI001925A4B9|nr:terminase large subunit [Mycobacterium intracellulare]
MKPNVVNGRRIGSQIPTNNIVPLYVSSKGEDAVQFVRLCGIQLDEWQEYVLAESLNIDKRGKFAATEVCLLVPRQQGKTVIAECRELVGLFMLGEQLIIHSAQLFPTARESYLRQCARIRNVPDLQSLVHKARSGNDNVGIELKNGSRLLYQARGNDPSRGFTADLIVYDEAYGLTPEVISASLHTLSARPNPQLWYCSSTGKEDSEVLLQVRERALDRAPRVALFEWCADKGADVHDKEQWYKSNPALGIRLDEDFVETEGNATQWGKEFARERLGLWHDASIRDVIPKEWWEACGTEDESQIIGDELIAAVDVSPFRDSASVAMCGLTASGRRQVEVIASAKGTNWIVDYFTKLLMSSNAPTKVVIQGGGAAGSLIAPLIQAGADLIVLGQLDVGRATGEFHDAVRDKMVTHLNDPLTFGALANATRYSIGSKTGEEESPAWGFARKDTAGHDITPIVACCYAHYGMSKYFADLAQEEVPHHVGTRRGGRIW